MSRAYYQPGRYRAEIINQALGEAGTGNPQIVWRIKVLETDTGEQVPAQYERTIYRTITEKSMPYILEDLQTLGYEHESFRMLDPAQPGFQDFRGQIITVFCQHELAQDGNGDREKWGIANANAFEVKPIESAKLRQLDSMFGKHLKGLGKGATAPRSSPVAAGVAVDNDDVPF